MSGRQLVDNIYEAESGMLSFLAMRARSVAALLPTWRAPFPSLSRRWIVSSLAALEVPPGVLRFMFLLDIDYPSFILFSGAVAWSIDVTSGVKSRGGVPWLGSSLAYCVY